MKTQGIDIKENFLKELDPKLLQILLKDHSSNKNIVWATSDYERYGKGYEKYRKVRYSRKLRRRIFRFRNGQR